MITAMMISITTSKNTDTLTNDMLLSRFLRATFAKACSSAVSFTKALMTRMPLKFSCVKS